MSNAHSWFYTAPLDALGQRRGDPLGFRSIADSIADALVPGLSNGTQDGRWLSIVCWILNRVQPFVRERAESRQTRAEAYTWIRPAELLWVASSLYHDNQDGAAEGEAARWLPQEQAVGRWLDNRGLPNMGLSDEAWVRYRFAGPYGAWRTVLRSFEITNPDGLTLKEGGIGRQLSDALDALMHENGFHGCDPFVYVSKKTPLLAWSERFANWPTIPTSALPTNRKSPQRLKKNEAHLLRQLFFKAGTRPKVLAKMVQMQKLDHATLAGRLAADCAKIRYVNEFSTFSDAAINTAQALIAAADGKQGIDQRAAYDAVLSDDKVKSSLDKLAATADAWNRLPDDKQKRYRPVSELARKVATNSRTKAVQHLIEHHETHHAGRVWLQRADGSHFVVIGHQGRPSAYSFRLWTLYRLGVQAGCFPGDAIPLAFGDHSCREDDDE